MDMTEWMNDFLKANWVRIPNTSYIMKYAFSEKIYQVAISNLCYFYSEKLEESNILERFSELNPFAEMKFSVILENLKKSLEKGLHQESEINLEKIFDTLILSVQFSAGLVSCTYKFKMNLMEAEEVTRHIISPAVFNALLCQKKIMELEKKLMTYECSKSSSIYSISVPPPEAINPDWVKGKNVPAEVLLDSFVKIQNCSKNLYTENLEAYNASGKKKYGDDTIVQCISANKVPKLKENLDVESSSIKFEDSDEKASIKEETAYSDDISSQMRNNPKRKKHFKI